MYTFVLQVNEIEQEQKRLVSLRQREIIEKYRRNGQLPVVQQAGQNQVGQQSTTQSQDPNIAVPEAVSQECILREICATMSHRKKLRMQV